MYTNFIPSATSDTSTHRVPESSRCSSPMDTMHEPVSIKPSAPMIVHENLRCMRHSAINHFLLIIIISSSIVIISSSNNN